MNTQPLNPSLPRPPRPRIPVWQRKLGIPEHSLPSNQTPMGLFHRAAQISADLQKPYQRPGRGLKGPVGPVGPVRPPAPPEAGSKAVPLPLIKKELLDMISVAQEKLRKEREAILKNMQQNKMGEGNTGSQPSKVQNTVSGREGAGHNLERSQLGRGRDVIHNSQKSGFLGDQLNKVPSRMAGSGGPQRMPANSDNQGGSKPVLGMHDQGGYGNARFPGPDEKSPATGQPARYGSTSEQGDRHQIEIVSTQCRAPKFERPHPAGQRHVVRPADPSDLKSRPYGLSNNVPPKPVYSGFSGDMPQMTSGVGAKGSGHQHTENRLVSDWQRPNGWSQGGITTSGLRQNDWNSWGGSQQHDRSFSGVCATTGESQWQQYSQMGSIPSQFRDLVMIAQQTLQKEYSYLSGGHYC